MAPGLELEVLPGHREHNITDATSIKSPIISVAEVPPSPPEVDSPVSNNNTLVLNPAFVTQEFDLLRFEAAAFNQIPSIPTISQDSEQPHALPQHMPNDSTSRAYSTLLISSPYNNPGHYLDLLTLSTSSLLFAKALTALKPLRSDYATAPYTSALNFNTVLSVLRDLARQDGVVWQETSLYVVVFRSQLKDGIDNDWLYKLDYESHAEACESGGLLKYWFGKGDGERRNLATCKFSVVLV